MEEPRITEVNWLEAENLKTRNHWWVDGDKEYTRTGRETPEQLHHEISNVRNGDLRKVMKNFPIDWPLCEQCAAWIHAIAGKHYFPDANHRTAIGTLRELLRYNGITHISFPAQELEKATKRSHTVRKEITNVELDTLYRKDKLWLLWVLFFKNTTKNPVR
jgi:prophage maintenance system killer protein